MNYQLHELPGRLRVKIPMLKRNETAAQKVQTFLEEVTGISSASANALTGSVVIKFDPRVISSREIVTILTQEGYIDLAKIIAGKPHNADGFSKIGALASRALLGLAVEKTFEGSALSLLTVFI
jgi:copper chaperone CopZ